MEEDWEQLSGQEQVALPVKKQDVNKWDGEDEEEDVKDSWEDEDEPEEKKDEEKVETPKAKPKKTLQEKIVEKEKIKQEEDIRRQQEELQEENMTPEQKLAEKLRIQKLQEESDLKNAMDTFGVTSLAAGIDGMHPTTKEEFIELADAINKKLSNYRNDAEYQNFLEDLITKIFASLPSANIRKVKGMLDNLYLEKQKIEKGDKPKKSKGKVKAKLRLEGDNANLEEEYGTKYEYDDEYDDFM